MFILCFIFVFIYIIFCYNASSFIEEVNTALGMRNTWKGWQSG